MVLFGLAAAGTTLAQSYEAPRLNINIPNVTFSGVDEIDNKTKASIPFLAEYIRGIYVYLIGIAGVIAGVMSVMGGFQYLTAGGDAGKVKEAKERITNAVIGVILLLGAFTILKTVSPSLVELKGLEIPLVSKVDFELDTLGDTKEETAVEVSSGGPTGSRSGLGNGEHVANTTCPVQLAATDEVERRHEFEREIVAAIAEQDQRKRVLAMGDAMVACGMNYGSCGATAGATQALASGKNTECFAGKSTADCLGTKGSTISSINSEQRKRIYGQRCEVAKGKSREDCVTNSNEARKILLNYFRAEAAAGRMPGWPDEWANKLKPGDYVVFYNGNKDLTGTHAVTFLGWTNDGWMQIAQGSFGKKVTFGNVCVKSSCGEQQVPLIYAYSPK